MSEQKQQDTVVMLENVRVAFPAFWVAEQVNNQGKPGFGGTFLMPPDHPSLIVVKQGIKSVAIAKWGAQAVEILKQLVAADRVCLHNGDAKAQIDGYAGNMFVSTRSPTRPLVLNTDKTPLTEADGKPYSGCFVNAQIAIWAMQNTHGKRVCAQIRGVQFLRDGPAFGGATASQVDEFDIVADGADDGAPDLISGSADFADFADIL